MEGLAAIQERNLTEMQVIYNLFEQDPARDFFAAARDNDTGFLIRVPHSSGLLEGRYTIDYPDLTADDLSKLEAPYAGNFGVEEPPMQFKGFPVTDPRAHEVLGLR